MKLDKRKIENQTFSVSKFSKKFRLAKTKKYVGGTLQELGATIVKEGGKCLVGRETENFYTAFANADYVFEGELEDRSYQESFEYFKNFDLKFYDMMRGLLATDNISFTYISIGAPLVEEDFAKLEKKLKRSIPKAVKEFYSIFGELRILWKHRNPYINTGRNASKKAWNLDYHDNHVGSFQILPLKTVLFEKWEDERYCFDVGADLKIFDTSSDYHMVALDISDEGDPLVYRGEDHGIQFREASPMLFTKYMDLCLGLYGTRERLGYFQLPGATHNKSEAEIQAAIAGKADIDINNDAFILPKIEEITTKVDKAISIENYKLAQDQLMDLHGLRQPLFDRYMIDLDRLQQKEDAFAKRIAYAVKDKKFDWQAYEQTNQGDPIFESKAYLKVKKAF